MSESEYIRPSWKRYHKAWEDAGEDLELAALNCGVSKATVKRAICKIRSGDRRNHEDTRAQTALMARLQQVYTPDELHSLIQAKKTVQENHKAIHSFDGEVLTVGVLTDTHIGSKYTNVEYIYDAFREFEHNNVDMVVHCGDLTEGMYNNRPGHALECTDIGYERQLKAAIDIFSQYYHSPVYCISGNHDATYQKQSGANIVQHFCNEIDNATYLGHDEGDIHVGDVNIRLWHGQDGSSYAHSYRLQKIIESFTGGEKPHVLFAGHVHKSLYSYDRHVHCVSAGAIQKQSRWMRSKRLPSHTGFYIVSMVINENGVGTFCPTWYPFYT